MQVGRQARVSIFRAILILLAAAAFGGVDAGEIPFERSIVSTDFSDGPGDGPRYLAAGDLDGDGDLDLIVAATDISGPSVLVFENVGGPVGFAPGLEIGSCASALCLPGTATLEDMDGDGSLDLVTFTTAGIPAVKWLSNDGQGAFDAQSVIRNDSFDEIAIGDVDGDGDPDVAAASGARLVWFTNNGGGSFNPATENLVDGTSGADYVKMGDLDGDGDLDLLSNESVSPTKRIVWYENTDGAGSFSALQQVATVPSFLGLLASGDIDGDGDLDAVSKDVVSGIISWHENTAGDASAWTTHEVFNFVNGTTATIVDLDLDGDQDILAHNLSTARAVWIENTAGDGSAWTRRDLPGVTSGGTDLIDADIDGDGDPDVISAGTLNNPPEITLFENRTIHRNAAFDGTQSIIGSGIDGFSVYPIDLDLDGDMDALSASQDGNTISWHESDGATPPGWITRTISTGAMSAWDVWADDVDGDGDVDALSASFDDNKIAWYDNDGATPPGWTERVIDGAFNGATSVRTVDLDKDGDVDVVATSQGLHIVRWYESDGASPPVWTPRDIATSFFNARSTDVVDVDGDGDLDVMGAAFSVATLRWWDNDGAVPPGWTQRDIGGGLSGANYVQAADIDHDGDVDAFSAELFGSAYKWYESDGATPPTFSTHTIEVVPGTNAVWTGHMADLDQDGDLDVIGAALPGVVWYENDGDSPPEWTRSTIFSVGSVFDVSAADVDGDGATDVLSAEKNFDRITWYENRGGQFGFTGADEEGSGLAFDAEPAAILDIVTRLNARSGDSLGRLTTLEFEFRDANGGSTLSSAQANALIEDLKIYRDADDSGTFDAGDTLVQTVPSLSLTGGVQTVSLPASDSNVLVGSPVSLFVVAELTADASSQAPGTFAISHLSESGPSTAVDADSGIELLLEYSPDFQGQTVTVEPTFVVDSTTDAVDANPGDGICATAGAVCTLRAAVQEANALAGDNRIVLPAGTYTLTIPGRGEDGSAMGDLDIAPTAALTDWTYIVGAGPGQTIIDGGGLDRVIHVNSFRLLSLENLTVQGGNTTGTSDRGAGVWVSGFNNATLVVRSCEFRDNASGFGGGAIFSSGTATITDSLFRGNFENGGVNGDAVSNASSNAAFMEIVNSTFSGNVGGGGANGAIGTQGATPTTIVRGCTLSENSRGIAASNVQVENSIVAGNLIVDISGSNFTSLGHNLVGSTINPAFVDGVNGDQVGTTGSELDARLEPLGDNGGLTLTHALKPSSPAIDAGSCGVLTEDQRGEARPVDIPAVIDVDDGCDIGAFEAKLGQTQARLSVPVRWCGLNGAPSIDDPSVLQDGDTSPDDVLRKRHEKIADEIYRDQANVSFVSAAGELVPSFPLLDDPFCASGCPAVGPGSEGDVFVDPDTLDFTEFDGLVAACRAAWHSLDPRIQGITGVQIGRFVNDLGTPIGILGIGGRPAENDPSEQVVAGRVMVIDRLYRLDLPGNPSPPNPEDLLDQLLGHEMGHALSLRHGDGVDNDDDGTVDNDDEPEGQSRLDGTNLMQYRNGTTLTSAQGAQIRTQASATIPDVVVQSLTDGLPDAQPIPSSTVDVLEHGFGGLSGVDVANDIVRKFKNDIVRKFENDIVRKFQNDIVRKFENDIVRKFENADIPHFGMTLTGTTPTDSAIPHAATGTLPWPAPIEYRTFYHFYLDLDSNDATGTYPADKANPSDGGNLFPGVNNFQNMPDLTEEAGIDLIAQIELFSICTSDTCDTFSELRVFDYNDGSGIYEQVHFENDTDITARGLGLYQQLDSEYVESEDVPAGLTLQPRIPVSILTAAGLGFQGGRPNPIRMEVVASIECSGNVINGDAGSALVDCSCDNCASCPDYPGCVAGVGTPNTLNGDRIVTDAAAGVMTFEPPRLPQCAVSPALAAAGQAVTAHLTQLPTTIAGQTVQVQLGDTVLGSAPTGSIDADGNLSVAVTLPADATGPIRLTARITGSAIGVDCSVGATPTLACTDTDSDGECDVDDTDDDNDGILDGADREPLNPLSCGSSDADVCDDCSSGTNDPANDGPDADLDGICDVSDTDDDDDGTADASDCAPLDASVSALPGEVSGVDFLAGAEITWDGPLPGEGGDTRVEVLRGTVGQFPVGAGAETCLGATAAPSLNGGADPVAGTGYWYLLRRTNVCGAGTYGFASGAVERVSLVCP